MTEKQEHPNKLISDFDFDVSFVSDFRASDFDS